MPRPDGRSVDELRPVEILPGFQQHPQGSVLIKVGGTWVVCAAFVEDRVPPFIKSGSGWVTAEYSMLPSATHTRGRRSQGGRDKEIQRLIGRALRGVVAMQKLGERTVTLDCDVLQADGGTRCASITGACVALGLALGPDIDKVLRERIAAVSVGIVDGEVRLDLSYEEDSNAEVDMNVVMTESGQLVEVQGTAEGRAFSRDQLDAMLDMAAGGIKRLCELQRTALEAQ